MKILKTTLFFLFSITVYAQDLTVSLYEGEIPFAKENVVQEYIEMEGQNIRRVSAVNIPEILVFKPGNIKHKTKSAILICPGGGYSYLSFTHEGIAVARWLNTLGVTGIVLKSRLPDDRLMEQKEDVPLIDAQHAMELIRENAQKWNIDTNKIGVMGFSAGGHLAASLSTHYDTNQRPDFSVLVYPVITMDSTFTHMGSRRTLVGESPTSEIVQKYSNEKQITKDTPPAFLVHSADDRVVPFANSIKYFEALNKNGVDKSELFIFQNGGHGYGMALEKDGNVAHWSMLLEIWLEKNKWIDILD